MKEEKAYVITGPTSGIGYETALELAKHGTVVLVGRNRNKLEEVKRTINERGQDAAMVVCDVSDIISVKHAAKEIASLGLPIAGLLNNAGIMPQKALKNAQGWDLTFATNYLGAFALTEALVPHLPDGANVVFIGSAIEDPERKPAKVMGMKGGQYLSAESSAKGIWKPGGAKMAGIDAYATSKQCVLAAAMVLARETPRLHFNVIEPGITPGTGLGNNGNRFVHFLMGSMMQLMMLLPAFSRYKSTPKKSAKVISDVVTDTSGRTGVYFDQKGNPMQGSVLSRSKEFQERVVLETRALLEKYS
ncbi:SDR family NAD(P)-dependent oxidoreductase [Fluviicola sp.]|uniref:SDR family NAD(P)-dependent oxidoreductase n=1 Tax=Fluviicola sp. TaxID=1917219 RepID=UPI0031E2BF26